MQHRVSYVLFPLAETPMMRCDDRLDTMCDTSMHFLFRSCWACNIIWQHCCCLFSQRSLPNSGPDWCKQDRLLACSVEEDLQASGWEFWGICFVRHERTLAYMSNKNEHTHSLESSPKKSSRTCVLVNPKSAARVRCTLTTPTSMVMMMMI
jgi:hypothetical protein